MKEGTIDTSHNPRRSYPQSQQFLADRRNDTAMESRCMEDLILSGFLVEGKYEAMQGNNIKSEVAAVPSLILRQGLVHASLRWKYKYNDLLLWKIHSNWNLLHSYYFQYDISKNYRYELQQKNRLVWKSPHPNVDNSNWSHTVKYYWLHMVPGSV